MPGAARSGGGAPQPTVVTEPGPPGPPPPSPGQLAEWAAGDADLADEVLERAQANVEFTRAHAAALIDGADAHLAEARELAAAARARANAAQAAADAAAGGAG